VDGASQPRSELDAPTGATRLRCEVPVLAFTDYAVAFHLAVRAPADDSDFEGIGTHRRSRSSEEHALESYERDMLLYAYRHVAPVRSRPIPTTSPTPVTVMFPLELEFESEGKPILLRCSGAEGSRRVRHAAIAGSRTTFYGDVSVVTIVLRPWSSEDPTSELNEYDVIKLAKLWEGGERLPEPGAPDEIDGPVSFDLDGDEMGLPRLATRFVGEQLKFHEYHGGELASAVSPRAEGERPPTDPWSRRHYRVGTVTLKLPATRESRRLLADAQAVKELSGRVPKPGTVHWRRVVALGGLIQGLLDFSEIGPAELSDVFAEAELDEGSLLAFHKGTLLSLSIEGSSEEEEREAQLARPMGVSPYLVVPHVVLLHNEQRLKWALIEVNKLLEQQSLGGRLSRGGGRISIDDTEASVREISDALAQRLPNIFHYHSERELYEGGSTSRGFDDFDRLIRSRLEELRGRLEARTRQRDAWTVGLTITFFAIAALQLGLSSVPKGWSLLILATGAAIVWQLRRKLF
jgi:hypothetical protein